MNDIENELKEINDLNDDLLDNPLKIMSQSNEITSNQILNNLLHSDKNLALKTEISQPKKLALLLSLANYLKIEGYPKSSKIIIDFIENYLTYMVSNGRKSRKEIIKALTYNERRNYTNTDFINNLD